MTSALFSDVRHSFLSDIFHDVFTKVVLQHSAVGGSQEQDYQQKQKQAIALVAYCLFLQGDSPDTDLQPILDCYRPKNDCDDQVEAVNAILKQQKIVLTQNDFAEQLIEALGFLLNGDINALKKTLRGRSGQILDLIALHKQVQTEAERCEEDRSFGLGFASTGLFLLFSCVAVGVDILTHLKQFNSEAVDIDMVLVAAMTIVFTGLAWHGISLIRQSRQEQAQLTTDSQSELQNLGLFKTEHLEKAVARVQARPVSVSA